MKKRDLPLLTSQTNVLLKNAQDFLDTYTQELYSTFSSHTYKHFYDITTPLFYYKFMTRKLDYLKRTIHRELLMLLDPDASGQSDSVQLLQDNIDVIKSYRELEMSLDHMKYTIVHHPYTSFVDIIKKQ